MGRKSKLTEAQLAEAQKRHIAGESMRAIARDMGIGESTLRERISAQSAQIKLVANQIVATERAMQQLPIGAQITAHNLAAKLRAISDDIASAAMYGAKTAHRLNALANSEVAKIDDATPLTNVDALRGVAALTKLANDSASIALNLLSANKDAVKDANAPKDEAHPLLTDSQREMLRGHFNAAV